MYILTFGGIWVISWWIEDGELMFWKKLEEGGAGELNEFDLEYDHIVYSYILMNQTILPFYNTLNLISGQTYLGR